MKRKLFSCFLCLVLVFALAIPAAANEGLLRIVDNADLLTPEEELELMELADTFRADTALDAVVLTVDSLGGKAISSYAEDYYDRNGYGVGPDHSGLILVVAMAERELYIATTGDAIKRFNDDELDTIISGTSYWLSEGEYFDAFDTFFGLTPLYLDVNADTEIDRQLAVVKPEVNWLLSVLIGLVAAGIAVMIMVSSMNTKRKQHSAGDYVRQGSYDLKNRQDIFLYSNISKVKREQNNSSGGHGGGTSIRTGSSGRSHGGRGGRF